MILSPRLPNGEKRKELQGDVKCPYAYHLHRGDQIEIELEMIICQDQAEQFCKRMGWNI